MHTQSPSATEAYAAPAWDSITDEIGCPMCEYNLRGLHEPRCPECGYRFAWPEVLDPARRKHRYIFEHHPESNVGSFFRTLTAGWRRDFWSELNPAQRVYPRRLVLYWVLTSIPFATALFLGALCLQWPNVLSAIDEIFDDDLGLWWVFLLWPWAVFVSLQVFRWSMRKSKVSTRHALRCVVYTHDVTFWTSCLAMVAWCAYLVSFETGVWPRTGAMTSGVFACWAAVILGGHLAALVRLHRAYRMYMRFDYVTAMLLCVLVISLLLIGNVLVLFA